LPACFGSRNGFNPTTKRYKEVTNVKKCGNHRSPPRRRLVRPLERNQLWSQLTDEQRHRTLATLSGIVVRQLDAARNEQEVRNERS
jgi:hypothetical protein